jgi:AraC-like DNA-binding protein
MSSHPSDESDVVSATEKLVAAAAHLEAPDVPADHDDAGDLRGFSRLYREWITFNRGVSGAPSDRLEKSHLLMHCMVSAPTLGDALDLVLRFRKYILGDRGVTEVVESGASVILKFDEPFRPGAHGFVSDLWPLALILSQLEWLVGGTLEGVVGHVRHAASLPAETAALLFDRPIEYEMPELALVLPKRHLTRPVVARAGGVAAFIKALPLVTLKGAGGRRPDLRALVAGLVRKDVLSNSAETATLSEIAHRLGQSPATMRRRLAAEGTGFREIREEVLDELGKAWLADDSIPIETIADRLGYSDTFAFRRSFRRHNGYSPTAFRREFGVPEGSVARR